MTLSLVVALYPLPSLCWSIFKLWPFYLRFKYDFLDTRHGRVSSCGFLSQIQHAEYCSDDLPLWGMFVGELHPDKNSDNKHVLYTHKNIIVKYNKDQIIHVNLTQESPKPLEVGRALDMTYSVKWFSINVTFARRFDVYLDYPFFGHQV
ncbi:Transmembrane 9 superfamily member 1 [Camellia lanceoleosa]|uniref:Transmembrane 9 superfamily member 1 n=1 Tax=Camellia lanceoleosa TaxID=1840588 RepID=A0ACC0IMR9_9ERIC|nr:Transmembrane 9 superfamily member 1 [Camellia lanceoleosa]